MSKKDIHVVPHEGGWATRREGAGRIGQRMTRSEKPSRRLASDPRAHGIRS